MKGETVRLPKDAPQGLEIVRDEHGVIHIVPTDLRGAHWGMGFSHALDRGLQMGMMRLLGQGRLTECLADDDEALAVDLFFRRMNWSGKVDAQLGALADDVRSMVDAYCEGANAAFGMRTPWELRLLGYRMEPWRPADVITLARMAGYLSLAQSQGEVERLAVQMKKAGVSDELLAALFGDPMGELAGLDLRDVHFEERVVPESVKFGLAAGARAMASNNWVVGPGRTVSGAAMMANDPHLEINRLPNVWVEQVVELPDDTVFYANMPGMPGPLLGRRAGLAWGTTYTFMDAIDSWIEDVRGESCRRGEGDSAQWEALQVREEVLKRKKHGELRARFWENRHGTLDVDPLHEGPLSDGRYLATKWASEDAGAKTLEVAVRLWDARSVEQGMACLGELELAFNWVFADAEGNIGYQMSGCMPMRHERASGFWPMPGWDEAFDWKGIHPAKKLPRVINPDQGYIVTANNDLNAWGEVAPINKPMGDNRARRIAALIEEQKCDRARMQEIQMDLYSNHAEPFLERLQPLLGDGAAASALRDWDRRYDESSRGATVFEAFYTSLRRVFFGEAETGVGPEAVRYLIDETGIFIDFYAEFDRHLLDPESPWLTGRSLDDVYRRAWGEVQGMRPRSWGEQNKITLSHMLLGGKVPRFMGFDRGPIALPGGRATPHQGQVYRAAGRDTSFAPSIRMVADLCEPELYTALVGGPSDRRFSRWYANDVSRWQSGDLKRLRRVTPTSDSSTQ